MKFENENGKLFKNRLKYLYKKINSSSNLFWTHENHLLGKRLRSENQNDSAEFNWKNSDSVQTGYGEVTMV